jgi:hypothetical protein
MIYYGQILKILLSFDIFFTNVWISYEEKVLACTFFTVYCLNFDVRISFCKNFHENENFRKTKFREISPKITPFSHDFRFLRKMKKTVFVSTLIRSHMRNSFRPWIRAPGWIVWWKKIKKSHDIVPLIRII